MVVTDAQLVERLHEFLRTSDLNTTTAATVRRQLEEDFSVDLTDKKAFIRDQIDWFLNNQMEEEKPQNDDVQEEGNELESVKNDEDSENEEDPDEEFEEEEEEGDGEDETLGYV